MTNNSVFETTPASSKTDSGANRNTVEAYQGNEKQEKKSNELVDTQNDFEAGSYKLSKWGITNYLTK